MNNSDFYIFLCCSTLAVHWSTWKILSSIFFWVSRHKESVRKMCQKCISRHEQSVGRYEHFSLLYSLCQSTWTVCWFTWVVRWSTWRLIKTCFSLFYLLFYFRHVFNKCTYLKHFKHTIKYNMSLLQEQKGKYLLTSKVNSRSKSEKWLKVLKSNWN